MKAFWTGCSLLAPMPSTVVTDLPAAARAGIKQLTTGTPSTSTVHAPQTPAPHTSFVPVRLSASRTTSMRRLSGSSGRGSTRPLMVIVLIYDLQVFGGADLLTAARVHGDGTSARGRRLLSPAFAPNMPNHNAFGIAAFAIRPVWSDTLPETFASHCRPPARCALPTAPAPPER